jgi:hypothetical protein
MPLAFYEGGANGWDSIPDDEIRGLALIAPRINVTVNELNSWRDKVQH